ncbi:MAG: hypothetical protein A2915_03275 [Candidatus Yanofskybacteria bacterium RIFCSPLOWO2_01_FULL_41_34]|uniref:NAD(P)-binding domain-containing protein n=1 Tax=Candidatus Yanofskybacteria bacterium RIFCSPHIGHO2_01_FULL_41_26 TaxID=1802661 RepID=A0A1F8EF41_9BACT|nr:MAG: hypothetical protein A2649_01170 [Candidatus Yanofskybacteria bacterium RIFCSPHIGHO2_01_FULL_41_26]OGN21054.1 MAG: hypothetical protein A2915_03275 [Candidatus Yanofskybacteria bacterium RIFCSPLOWO2_01_FULL_41_34]
MVNWKKTKVFVTGSNGFLGSHLVKKLIGLGANPLLLIYKDHPGSIFNQEKLDKKTQIIKGDVRDLVLIKHILNKNKIDIIFHLAAQPIVDQALDDPIETFQTNIHGTVNILQATLVNRGVKKIIVASSDKAYGHNDKLPYREDTSPLRGIYPYEVSKTCADLIAQSYHKTFGLPVCITRASNLYGPGDLHFNRIVPMTIKQLHAGLPPTIRDRSDSVRDYLYIEDAADAYIKLAEKMNKSIFGHAFNFSTNKQLSAEKVICTISKAMNKTEIEPITIKTRGCEIYKQYASFDKALRIMGWKPKHSFKEGAAKTIPWYVDHLNNKKNQNI